MCRPRLKTPSSFAEAVAIAGIGTAGTARVGIGAVTTGAGDLAGAGLPAGTAGIVPLIAPARTGRPDIDRLLRTGPGLGRPQRADPAAIDRE
jgi:hypothetical protein